MGTTRKARPPGGVPAGHPHVRGDYGLGRGELFNRKRAIPTCVGTTPAFPGPPGSGPGHPHVRGDYAAQMCRAPSELGPSPRAWGLLLRPSWPTRLERAIPTCVGTTGSARSLGSWASGHPHVRGDYEAPTRFCPRKARAIPTCVGTTTELAAQIVANGPSPRAWGLPRPKPLPWWWVTGHPHVRGDYPSRTPPG